MIPKRKLRWLWPGIYLLTLIAAGCDNSPPLTDETDPLPRVFNNTEVDPDAFRARPAQGGQGSGRSMDPSQRKGAVQGPRAAPDSAGAGRNQKEQP